MALPEPSYDPERRPTLREKVTPQQLDDLYNRRITGRALAAELGVTENWLSRNFSGKVPGLVRTARAQKKELFAARTAYRDSLARRIRAGEMTRSDACAIAHCSERTMSRHISRVKHATD